MKSRRKVPIIEGHRADGSQRHRAPNSESSFPYPSESAPAGDILCQARARQTLTQGMNWGLVSFALVGVAGAVGTLVLFDRIARASTAHWQQMARHLGGELGRTAWYVPWRSIRATLRGQRVELRERPPQQHQPGGVELRVSGAFGCTVKFWPKRMGRLFILTRLHRIQVDGALGERFLVYTDNPGRASLLLHDANKREAMNRLLDEGVLRIHPDHARLVCTDYRAGPGQWGPSAPRRGKVMSDDRTLLSLLQTLHSLG